MAIKELQTRIALKYDSYAKWTTAPGKDLQLLPGELGICEIESVNTHSNVAPTVLFKVGGATYPAGHAKAGQLMTFEDLPWASAKAADVYSWAKASDVTLVVTEVDGKASTKEIEFVGSGKKITLDYLTEKEVKAITDSLAARIVAVENAVNGAEGVTGIKASIEALDGRLDTLEGTGAGSVAKAQADAQAYADGKAAAAQTAAETTAKNYTDAEVLKDRNRLNTLEAYKTAHETEYTELEGRVDAVEQGVTNAESRINAKLGDGFSASKTVASAIEAAANAADAVDDRIDALVAESGQIGINKKKSEENAASISGLSTDLSNETTAREQADTALSNRLNRVETFFQTAEGETLDNALDTLVELQDYLEAHDTVADGMLDKLGEHDTALASLNSMVKDLEAGTNLKTKFESIDGQISDLTGDVASLQSITKGYTAEGSIKAAIDAAKTQADDGVARAKQAQADATDAQNRVGVIEGKVNDTASGLKATYDLASDNASDISDLKTLTKDYATVVQNVTDLKAIVETGDNSNAKLRSDIGTIQSIVNGTNGNSALAGRIKTVEDAVNHASTGLNALNTAVGDHDGRIAAIESDYLKASDQLIFQCGNSASNTFVAPTN